MQAREVPAALQERLGPGATDALVELLDRAFDEQRADMIAACAERYERRLVEEAGAVRVQLAQTEASIRQGMAKSESVLREDMGKMESAIRQDLGKIEAAVRQDISSGRVELFKWSFLFWIGQVFALAGMFAVMLRLLKP